MADGAKKLLNEDQEAIARKRNLEDEQTSRLDTSGSADMMQDIYEMTSRPSRYESLLNMDPLIQLREALDTNDYIAFEKIVAAVDHACLEHVYEYPDYKSCLEIAVSQPGKEQFVKLLLQHKVSINKINETDSAAPIHFAVEYGNLEALKALLEVDNIDINIKKKGNNTALLQAVKKIEELSDHENYLTIYENMIELLLKKGCDANAPDSKGVTPIYSASYQGLYRVVALLLEYSKNTGLVDLDAFKDRRGKTARHFIMEKFPNVLANFNYTKKVINTININTLFSYLYRHEEEKFIRDFAILASKNQTHSVFTAHSGMNNMLELATEKGLEKVVDILLVKGANPNNTFLGNTNRAIAIACRNGYVEILKKYVAYKSISLKDVNGDSLLQITINGMKSQDFKNPKVNHKECLRILLKTNKIDVNYRDVKNNTALHYAARNGDDEIVLELLRNGACIGLINQFNVLPLADINAVALERYLNECITINGNPSSNEYYEIHINFSLLAYPNNSYHLKERNADKMSEEPLINYTENDSKECDVRNNILIHETEALLYLAKSEKLKKLLLHPVFTSFLDLKWQRISFLFYANITFYTLLCICLVLYILLGYGVDKNQIDAIKALNYVTRSGTIVGLCFLILRELFQVLVTPLKYIQCIENWLEIVMIIVTTCIVSFESAKESTKQQLSAIAILFSLAELILLVSHFPTLSTYIVMLRTVSYNFLKFILWYCILIIAFALSFYTLFRQTAKEDHPGPKDVNENSTGNFFEDPGSSLFKTIVMLTGEFETGSIKFDTAPVTSHILFVIFVFMIPIVLFNLLNGLAVNDIQKIKADAELVGQILLIEMISYFESLFIANNSIIEYPTSTRCFLWPSYLKYWHTIKSKLLFIRPLSKRISFFPDFMPEYKIIVKPNDNNRIVIPGRESTEWCRCIWCYFGRCQYYTLDTAIVKNAKIIHSKKYSCSEFLAIIAYLKENNKRLENLENIFNILCNEIKFKMIDATKKDTESTRS